MDIVYYHNLWGRAQIQGLIERDPDQFNTFLHRWAAMLKEGETLPKEEAEVLSDMLMAVLNGKDARTVFRPKPIGRKRAGALGNDEHLDDLLRFKRAEGISHQESIADLADEVKMPGRTIESNISRTRSMNDANRMRMEKLAALDAFTAHRQKKFPNLEQACFHFARKSELDSYRIHNFAKKLLPK